MAARATRARLVAGQDYYLFPLSEKQLSKNAREELISAALRGEVELQPLQRERLEPRGSKPTVVEAIAAGYEVSVPLTAVHENLALH